MDNDQRNEIQDELDNLDPMLRVEFLTSAQKRETTNRLNALEAEGRMTEGSALFYENRELFEVQDDDDPLSDSIVAYWVSSEYLRDLYDFRSIHTKWS